MENPKVSILVPVYNVEKYLPRCIDSVLSQDFSDYELILVDDGSPDNSPRICDEYAQKDNRIKVVHKKNGGLVSARLAGFEASKGKYLMFLDSDDYLLPNALTVLYEKIEEGYDIVKGNDVRFCGEWTRIEKPPLVGKEIIEKKDYLTSVLNYAVLPYLWGGLYKRELFTEDVFRKNQDISLCEDWLTNIFIWNKVNRFFAIDKEVYAYFINQKSLMQQNVISFEYLKKLRNRITRCVDNNDIDINRQISLTFIISYIRGMFVPEQKWNQTIYDEVALYIEKADNYLAVRQSVDGKFLHFIKHRHLFYLYTGFYKLIFKFFRLNGKKRKMV